MKKNNQIAVVLVIILIMILSACTSPSQLDAENRVNEKCVIVSNNIIELSPTHSLYLITIKRLSDNVIVIKDDFRYKHYIEGDTIIFPFDKRYDYESIKPK